MLSVLPSPKSHAHVEASEEPSVNATTGQPESSKLKPAAGAASELTEMVSLDEHPFESVTST